MQLRKLWIHNGVYFSLLVWFDAEAAQQHLTTSGAVRPEASAGGGGGRAAAPFLGAHRHLAAAPRSPQRPAEPRNGVQLALPALPPCPAAAGRCRQRREEGRVAARPGPAGVPQRAGPGALVPRVFAHLAAPPPSSETDVSPGEFVPTRQCSGPISRGLSYSPRCNNWLWAANLLEKKK